MKGFWPGRSFFVIDWFQKAASRDSSTDVDQGLLLASDSGRLNMNSALRHWRLVGALLIGLAAPSILQAGPAPKITSVIVYAVHSAKAPIWVYPNPNTYSVSGEGGSWIVVCTREYGYGYVLSSTLGGRVGTEMLNLQTPIVSGGAIVGFYRYWLFQGTNVNGQFQYKIRSMNSPFNTASTWINLY
jgi:hypothetical protein